jgi:hypothetical protein
VKRTKPYARVWAAIWKKTGEVFLVNDKLSDLKADIGPDKRFRFAILREERKTSTP